MKYKMEDGTVIDTDRATQKWNEATDWNGNNWISRATGDQWVHQTLYQSRKGRYYIEHDSQWQGSRPYAEWVGPQTAAAWLIANDHEVPAALTEYADAVSE